MPCIVFFFFLLLYLRGDDLLLIFEWESLVNVGIFRWFVSRVDSTLPCSTAMRNLRNFSSVTLTDRHDGKYMRVFLCPISCNL